ncbi:heme exporter protein CcmB [uncultured Aquimonas sp.]|uniref:heme exporter protein CcmB n=1 Tax=uncultured Aquimonas sp. TaxID=385483 RepID=UPI00086DC793|nr:heme exporter protein CcmB [uncultured Aquimonas sp.]ODU48409.1 MAG: heme exporter protein CcmB [Xanthomonadaceae bacterium SCN 69-123]
MADSSALTAFAALLRRDLLLVWRRRGDALNPVLFALLVATLFPLAIGPEKSTLALIAPGVVWVALLLSGLLSLDTLFRGDLEDGSLEMLLLAPQPLALMLFGKVLVHWLTTAVPLLIATPLLAELLYLPPGLLPVLMASLLLGTPLLSLVGGVIVALTVGMRRSGMLLALLALPLYVPILILGAGCVAAAAQGLPYTGALLLLGAGVALLTILAPLATATALRIAMT